MYLFIDPTHHSHIRLVLFFSDHVQEVLVEGKNRELLQVIVRVLETAKIALTDIQGVVILVGQGGFSSTRIASVVGNALAYSLKVPIVGAITTHGWSFETIRTHVSSGMPGVYLSPTYSGEPSIGGTT
jgi:tRNA A37 threonylcarbamoyladenosine modification protein TsaB